jgi:uncharacterized protein YndB with AHSA1/START domain
VFEAHSKPEHIRRWWGPRGSTLPVCEIDFRVGGAWRYEMKRAGQMLPAFYGTFLEIEAPKRIVQTETFEPYPDSAANVTVTLVEKGGKTVLVNRSVYPSKDVRDAVIASGMEVGMRESMIQLTQVVASLL